MYELVSAIAKPPGGDGRWQAVDIALVGMSTLYSTYERVIATLTNPFLTDLVALDLDDIRAQAAGLNKTFSQFLIDLGNLSLPTSTTLPTIDPKWAHYADAFAAGYKVKAIHPTAADNSGYPPADLTFLRLTRPNTDYELFVRHCLVSVNGFIHPIDGNSNGVVVKWGNRSAQLSGVNTMGITSFLGLGELTQVPITEEMVFNQMGTAPLKNHAYVDLGQDVSDKMVMLVLGGYLHVLDQRTFFRINNSCFAIDFNNLPILERYYESKKYIDLTELPLAKNTANPNQVSVDEFMGDENIKAYLTLPQSFFVILDRADLFVEREELRPTKMVDMFVSHVKPTWPVVVGYGKMANYWATEEDTQWSISCRDSLRDNFLFNTIPKDTLVNVSNQRVPMQPATRSHAAFLKVGAQLGTTTMTREDWLAL
jgi:hypothetical protein